MILNFKHNSYDDAKEIGQELPHEKNSPEVAEQLTEKQASIFEKVREAAKKKEEDIETEEKKPYEKFVMNPFNATQFTFLTGGSK